MNAIVRHCDVAISMGILTSGQAPPQDDVSTALTFILMTASTTAR